MNLERRDKPKHSERCVRDAQRLVMSFAPRLAVRLSPDLAAPEGATLVDYSLTRIQQAGRACEHRELQAADRDSRRILIEAHPFDPADQIRHDLATLTVGTDVRSTPICAVLVRDRRTSASWKRHMAASFTELETRRSGTATLIIGFGRPLPSDLTPWPVASIELSSEETFHFSTWPGLFSGGHIDVGTRVLIDELPEFSGARVLDLGCGYGPLSVIAAHRGALVTYADPDARSLRLTKENLARRGLSGVALATTDLSECSDAAFHHIISNPPTHAGSDVLRGLFNACVRILKPGGEARFVVREHLNYEKWLIGLGRQDVLSFRDGFKILYLRKP